MDDTATDPATASRCRRKALRFLRQLVIKRSILPPSLFLNNLKRESSNGVQHAVAGGTFAVKTVSSVIWVVFAESHYQDIHKGSIQGTVFCFRVLRMFATPEALEEREKPYKVIFFVVDS